MPLKTPASPHHQIDARRLNDQLAKLGDPYDLRECRFHGLHKPLVRGAARHEFNASGSSPHGHGAIADEEDGRSASHHPLPGKKRQQCCGQHRPKNGAELIGCLRVGEHFLKAMLSERLGQYHFSRHAALGGQDAAKGRHTHQPANVIQSKAQCRARQANQCARNLAPVKQSHGRYAIAQRPTDREGQEARERLQRKRQCRQTNILCGLVNDQGDDKKQDLVCDLGKKLRTQKGREINAGHNGFL